MDCSWIGWCALKPEGQAAWVQAIGSIAAIAVAIWVANTQHVRLDRKRSRAIRTLMNYAVTTIKSDAALVHEMVLGGQFTHINPESVRSARRTLDSIRLDDLPEYRLIPHITLTSELLRLADDLISAINMGAKNGEPATAEFSDAIDHMVRGIEQTAVAVRRLDHDASSWLYRLVNRRPS